MAYGWLDDDAFCATHVRGLTPHEALARLGIEVFDGDDEEREIEEGLICAYQVEGGTILGEENGFAGTLDEVLVPLSAGTVVASVFVNVNRHSAFNHFADGREVLSFDPLIPDDRDDQTAFLTDRIELGLVHGNSEGGLVAARRLAERTTDVRPGLSTPVVVAHGFYEY
ncbi:DUF6461 domain-containing protein [Streptosporangium saharense]|uniref:DUF6461 domain-containing protein n=1 Tax=Streptosporangium saharense TaxID=1706840 RepID=UPI00341DEB5A